MEWTLVGINGEYLQDVNCQYDGLDIAVMFHSAKKVEVDFDRKQAKILLGEFILDFLELKRRILNVGRWSGNGKDAPHKPLLILYSLIKLQRDEKKEFSYYDIKDGFKKVLRNFLKSKRVHPEYPFIYLKNDGIWKLNKTLQTGKLESKELKELVGGFNDDIHTALSNNPEYVQELIDEIIAINFPELSKEEVIIRFEE